MNFPLFRRGARVVLAQPADPAGLPATEKGAGAAILRGMLLGGGLLLAGYTLRALGPGMLHAVQPTPAGAALLVGGGALLTAVGLPRQMVAFAGGFAFGAWPGGALSLAAQLAGCTAAFLWARLLGRDVAQKRLRGKWHSLDRFLAAHPFTATLTLRLLPVSNNLLLNLLAGVTGVRVLPFLLASLLGYLPQTAIFAMLGSGVHVQASVQIGIAVVLFAASAGLGLFLARRAGVAMPGRLK
jgi:uncharacterized membrane protein YdjX (TVP38/TMEM64 family)